LKEKNTKIILAPKLGFQVELIFHKRGKTSRATVPFLKPHWVGYEKQALQQ
jgi:hypothetical protein